MSAYKIAFPNMPYHSDIPGTMRIGKAIYIKGHIPSNLDLSSYIQINLLESSKIIPLHISIRFQYRDVVRNSQQFGVWETEEKDGPFPFRLGREFTMKILVQSDGYEISVDGDHCWSFPHRLSYLKAVKLHVAGPVRIEYIEYSHEKSTGQFGNWEPQPYSLQPVFNPSVPFSYPITGGIRCGMSILIVGKPLKTFHRSSYIQINLLESSKIIPLHISIRFQYRDVVRNSQQFGVWETEEKDGPFPFSLGREFTMKILVQSDGYEISVDGDHCWSFSHRLSYLKAVKLHVAGPVCIEYIECSHEKNKGQFGNWEPHPYSLQPVFNPSMPFCYTISGGIRCGMSILIVGKPLKKFHRFTLSLQNGQNLIPPPDVALQIDACAFNSTVVRNTRRNQMWEDDETAAPYFPFKPEKVFTLTIRVRNDKYVISIDGRNIIDYYHRMTRFSLINTLKIDNDVSINSIHFQETER